MFDFDKVYCRNDVPNEKWGICRDDEIAMWVADMDLATPQVILDALRERLEHPVFGYDPSPRQALKVVAEHYRRSYGCEVKDEWLVLCPSVMPGVNVGCLAAGGNIMYCTPMYSHIRVVAKELGCRAVEVPLALENGRYAFDFDAMERAYDPSIGSFILCNPHNPVGRMFSQEELDQLLTFCKSHHMTLVSDEIHCEFDLDRKHIPCFTLPGAEKDTVTVSSAGKICNIPGIPIGFAIVPDDALRERFKEKIQGLFNGGGTFNAIALTKAYDGSCAQWKEELRAYLRGNRDYMEQRIAAMPGISVNHNEGTYLAWIDCHELGLDNPSQFFREKAHVVYNDGEYFGDRQFVRLNYGCTRAQLKEALDRTEQALLNLVK